ncbi:MAG: DinB family protein [Rhodocyclaceae bacterium]|nr:DinB family protein [Rhodocyclaceae bacterium]MCE2978211.1 DinB family protein [Betaproteobacteria bacterium]MCA3076651.1 DinB family protein [Rhodocyclaceae bacterium]MCA3091438.1 DinB family protein [Rhodocyclaceae bacterium]MCA3094247.1 DinB family protein [Rhodocyclaceae bacterium]
MADIRRDPADLAALHAFGVRNLPVLARGSEFVFGQQLADVARFVGVTLEVHVPLAPEVLMQRWTAILRSTQRLCDQLPPQAIGEPPIEGRPGTLGELAWHVFGIGDGFIECVEGREIDWVGVSMRFPAGGVPDGSIARTYGDGVIGRLEQWWQAADAAQRSGAGEVDTPQGKVELHAFLERQTWHSGQHARQLADVIERHGGKADWPTRDRELQGLPMPVAVWG